MTTEMSAIRLLGAAQLIVFVAIMVSERLLASVVGSGPIASILVNISKDLTRMASLRQAHTVPAPYREDKSGLGPTASSGAFPPRAAPFDLTGLALGSTM